MIPERVSIDRRFLGANNRTRYGHWEKTRWFPARMQRFSRCGARGKSRLIVAAKTTMSPVEHQKTTKAILSDLMVKSVSFDNGIENKTMHIYIFPLFCDPYSSWQKGGVENANKMICIVSLPKERIFARVPKEDRAVKIPSNQQASRERF